MDLQTFRIYIEVRGFSRIYLYLCYNVIQIIDKTNVSVFARLDVDLCISEFKWIT